MSFATLALTALLAGAVPGNNQPNTTQLPRRSPPAEAWPMPASTDEARALPVRDRTPQVVAATLPAGRRNISDTDEARELAGSIVPASRAYSRASVTVTSTDDARAATALLAAAPAVTNEAQATQPSMSKSSMSCPKCGMCRGGASTSNHDGHSASTDKAATTQRRLAASSSCSSMHEQAGQPSSGGQR